jgi:hypothetical protein
MSDNKVPKVMIFEAEGGEHLSAFLKHTAETAGWWPQVFNRATVAQTHLTGEVQAVITPYSPTPRGLLPGELTVSNLRAKALEENIPTMTITEKNQSLPGMADWGEASFLPGDPLEKFALDVTEWLAKLAFKPTVLAQAEL